MTGALLALVLVACEHKGLGALTPERQAAACELLKRPAPEGPSPGELEAIYSSPGFELARRRDSGALAAWMAQLRSRLMALFETSGAEKYSSATRVLVLVVAVLGLALLALRLGGRRRRQASARRAARPGVHERLELERPEAHLARARALVEQQPRESLREALLALLSWLEQRRYARPDRVKTNRELALELAFRGAGPSVIAAVAPLLELYDAAFYSLEPVSAQSAGQFVARVAPVVEAAP